MLLLRISIVIAMIFGASAGRASQLQLSSSAVSIAATPEPDLYLIADYSKILLFDKHHGSITPMAIVGATRRNVPTGLAYDAQRNRLFIANYLSNNILNAIVDLPAKTITGRVLVCDQEQLNRVADAAIDQINKGSELRLGTLISAAMLNPCVGRHFIARAVVH